MVISGLPGIRLTRIQRQFVVAVGMCTVLLAVPSNTGINDEVAENAAQQLRIKRLKPADPESTETMLATNRSDIHSRWQILS